jgi:hypothetical protein
MNLSAPQLQALVQAATLAPSSHNTHPWLFWLEGTVIGLLADRTRALPVNDPEDRGLTISCGCALFNLRVAAADADLASRTAAPTCRHAGRPMSPIAANSPLMTTKRVGTGLCFVIFPIVFVFAFAVHPDLRSPRLLEPSELILRAHG